MSVRAPARRRALATVVVMAVVSGAVVFAAPRAVDLIAAPRAADPAVGGAPGYVLMDLPAIKRAMSGRGHPVLVHFWASWCGPCIEELPLIDRFARDVKARGVELLSLSLDDPQRAGDRVVKVLTQRAPSLTRNIVHIDDPDAFIGAIDPQWEGAIPAIFAYDSQGRLRGRLIGEASRRDLDSLVARLVKPSTK